MLWDSLVTFMRVGESALDPEPRWPAFVAVLAVGGIYAGLPDALTVGPRWAFPYLVLALLIPTVASHHTGRHRLNSIFGFLVELLLTAFSLWGHQHFGVCSVVLATGRRGAAPTG